MMQSWIFSSHYSSLECHRILQKSFWHSELKPLRQAKEDAYRSGEKALYNQAKYTLNREIRVAKKNYTGKLKKNSFQVTTLHQCGKAWKPLPATRPLHPALRPINNWLKTWTIFTVGFKNKSLVWHPTPTLTIPQHSHQHLPPPSPYCFSACNQDLWRRCKQSLQETEDKESQRPRWCLSSLPQSLCCPAIIHLHIDLQ